MNILDFFKTMSSLSPSQNNLVEMFKKKPTKEQAEEIARICNERGITKDDLVKMINGLKGK